MNCPKCKARIGVVKHEIVLDSGVIHCLRCVMCGYWSQPHPTYNRQHRASQTVTVMMLINKTKYAEIGRKMRALPLEEHTASYEWEELVQRLCVSVDAGLHDIGIKELGELRQSHRGM